MMDLIAFSWLLMVLAQMGSVRSQTASVPPPTQTTCIKFKSSFCTQAGIGWTNASLPNLVGTTTVAEVEESLSLYYPLYAAACSNAVVHLICAVHYPVCYYDGEQYGTLKPCRELCEYVRCTCESVVTELGAEWPTDFECSKFPSGDETSLCYPGKSSFDFFRTNLRFPEIGPDHEEVTRCEGLTTTPPPSNASMVNTTVPAPPKCPVAALRVPSSVPGHTRYQLAGYQECGLTCDPTVLTGQNLHTTFYIILLLVQVFVLGMMFITIMTFGIDRKRFPYPQRPFLYIALTYTVIAIINMVGNISGLSNGEPGCDPGGFTMQGQPLSLGEPLTSVVGGCSTKAVILYYCSMAALTWWVILSFTWFLATALKWAEEAIAKFWILYHVLAWGVPVVQLILVLVFQTVDAELPTGVCYIGNSNLLSLGLAVFTPSLVYTALGSVFFIISIAALGSIYRNVRDETEKANKIKLLIVRVGILGFTILIPNAVMLALYIYELTQRSVWERHALCSQATPTELSSLADCTDLPRSPAPYGFFFIKHIVWIVPAVAAFTWILSKKTLEKWKDFGKMILKFEFGAKARKANNGSKNNSSAAV
uniref:FzdF n=1 Tax=Halisarca dujardinii TaxID=2583056 RepID=A0A8F8ASE4_HALDU|nr:frizzled F HduFzdF [Halisarca dujardinii]